MASESADRRPRLYRDQLAMTERHLESLIEDTNGALDLLASLAESFRVVEDQTTSFKAQCDDLLSEQKRLQTLAHEVGTDLYYYEYLDNVTRRLNAPGASRLVDDEDFTRILANLDSCIAFMAKHVSLRLLHGRAKQLTRAATLPGRRVLLGQIPGAANQSPASARGRLHVAVGGRVVRNGETDRGHAVRIGPPRPCVRPLRGDDARKLLPNTQHTEGGLQGLRSGRQPQALTAL